MNNKNRAGLPRRQIDQNVRDQISPFKSMNTRPLASNRSVTQVIEDITLARLTGRKYEPEMKFDELDSIQRDIISKSEAPSLIIGKR